MTFRGATTPAKEDGAKRTSSGEEGESYLVQPKAELYIEWKILPKRIFYERNPHWLHILDIECKAYHKALALFFIAT